MENNSRLGSWHRGRAARGTFQRESSPPSVSNKGLQQLIRFAGPFFYQVPTRSPTPTLKAIALIEIGLVELRDLGVHVTPFSWSLVTPEDGSGRLVAVVLTERIA